MKVVQLVPRLPPPVCGVGDYAMLLAKELEANHQFQSAFITNSSDGSKIGIKNVLQHLKIALQEQVNHQSFGFLIVQYSGYGFAKRGAPIRLVQGLRSLKKEMPSVKVITMFHELFAHGSPVSSSFWFSPLQKWVAASLAKYSAGIVTNREASAVWLKKQVGMLVPVHAHPVFSNFGEPSNVSAASKRSSQLVIFGRREGLPLHLWSSLAACMTNLAVEKIVVVSQMMHVPPFIRSAFAIEENGVLPPEEISHRLSESRFGFLDYNPDFLGKSGVLAAFAAHGVIPVLAQGKGLLNDGLQERVHYLHVQTEESNFCQPVPRELLQSSLLKWYSPHSLKPTASLFASLMN